MRIGLRPPKYDCDGCTDRQKEKRNCHNRQGRIETIIHKSMWAEWPASIKHIYKNGDLKLFECPHSVATQKTKEIIGLVLDTTDENTNCLHMPFDGNWLDQPEFYRTAKQIIKKERAAHRQWLIDNPKVKAG